MRMSAACQLSGPAAACSLRAMTHRRLVTTTICLAVLGAWPVAAHAKPHVTGSFRVPSGLSAGGSDQHGLVLGRDRALWMATGTNPLAPKPKQPVLLRITSAGRMSAIKLPTPGGLGLSGLAVGPDGHIWFSGTAGAGTHRGYRGRVVGHRVKMKEASDSSSWSSLASIGHTAYLVDGFNGLSTSTDGETITYAGALDNVSPWDIGVLGGKLALVGDGSGGLLSPGATAATPFTVPAGADPVFSRSLTVAHGKVWFTEGSSNGATKHLGEVSPTGQVTYHALPAPGLDVVTGPDGDPWVLSQRLLVHMTAAGKVKARVRLPGGQVGILESPGPKRTMWVATSATGGSRLLRVAAR